MIMEYKGYTIETATGKCCATCFNRPSFEFRNNTGICNKSDAIVSKVSMCKLYARDPKAREEITESLKDSIGLGQ